MGHFLLKPSSFQFYGLLACALLPFHSELSFAQSYSIPKKQQRPVERNEEKTPEKSSERVLEKPSEPRASKEKLITPQELEAISKETAKVKNSSGREKGNFKISLNAFSLIPHPGFGGNLGYFITENLLLEAEGNVSYFNKGTPVDPTSSSILLQAHGKFFFPASFYVTFGGGYQTTLTQSTFESDPNSPNEEVYTATLFDTVGVTAAVGSEWHFGWWSVGAEYLGIYLPFGVVYKDFRQVGLKSSEEIDERIKFRKAKPNAVPTLLKLKIGVHF